MAHDLKISARAEKSPIKTQNTFQIQGGSKLEVFDEDGKLLHSGEFQSFTANFLKLLYGSMIGSGTAKAKDLTNNDVEMNAFPQCAMNLTGGFGLKKFGLVVGTNSTAVSVSDYNITVPAGLTVNDTVVGASSVGVDSISVEISRQIGNSSGSTVNLKEAGLICGSEDEINSNILIARDLLDVTLESGKKSVWRYTINFNFANDVGGFVKSFADQMFNGVFKQITAAAAWSVRSGFGCVVFNDKIWVMGGTGTGSDAFNDVWYSSDGITWTQATSSANWTVRKYFGCVVFNNKIWVLGGQTTRAEHDVWYSSDGITWTQATSSANWTVRFGFGCVVFNDKIWVLGGYVSSSPSSLNDVWYSSDGITWTQATSSANWTIKNSFGCVVFNDKIWVLGGYTTSGSYFVNDVWYSSDGITWTQATSSANWTGREHFGCVVFNNKIWVMGGAGTGSNRLNDVWVLKKLISEIKLGTSDSAFSATATALGAVIANGSGSGQLVYGEMPGAGTMEPSVSGNKTKFSIAREFTNNSGADITAREVGLFSGSDMLARLILAAPVTIANGGSEIITVDFETDVTQI